MPRSHWAYSPRFVSTSIGVLLGVLLVAAVARAQSTPEPATAPPSPSDPAPASAAAPDPAAVPTPPPASPTPPPPATQPASEPAPPPQTYEGQVSPGGEPYQDPSYPEEDPNGGGDSGGGFKMPGFSIRVDPFNWLLQGRLPFELEVGVWKFISFELVPEFVTNEDPPLRDFSGYESGVNQYSNGIGDLSGTAFGVGFWLDGKPFEGYVLKATLTNYGYVYKSEDRTGTIDRVERTTRRFGGFIGSYRRWGFFTIGGGIGLSYELHQQERCDLLGTPNIIGASSGCDGQLQIALDRDHRPVDDTNGFLHPVYLDARFSLGIVID